MPKKKSNQQWMVEVNVDAKQLMATDQYISGMWAGQPHFECKQCEFDALDEITMLNHLVDRHNLEEALKVLIALEPAPTPPLTHPHLTPSANGDGNIEGEDNG